MYYVYVLYSKEDKKLYVGYTDNLKRRIAEHQNGLVPSTKHRRPLELIYYEACLSDVDAVAREKSLKTGFGRHYLKNRLKNYFPVV